MVLLATTTGLQLVSAQSSTDAVAAKARAKVASLGPNAKVEVKLQDSTKLKGYISANEQDSFAVRDSQTGSTTTVRYADVAEVKKSGSGFSTKWIVISAAAVAGAIATWVIVKPALCDGGAQTRGPC